MTSGYQFEKPLPIYGRGFAWRPYKDESLISNDRFCLEQWHRIVYDIDSDRQWREFLKEYSHLCCCYVLYPDGSDEPIAMCYVLGEHALYEDAAPGSVVSVHGGGWKNDMGSKLMYAKSWITIVHHLVSLGCRVLTNVKEDNPPAVHLVTKTGFRPNKEGDYEYCATYDSFCNKLKNI